MKKMESVKQLLPYTLADKIKDNCDMTPDENFQKTKLPIIMNNNKHPKTTAR